MLILNGKCVSDYLIDKMKDVQMTTVIDMSVPKPSDHLLASYLQYKVRVQSVHGENFAELSS